MAESAAPPEDSWQHVICHICRHPFDLVAADAEAEPVSLCQTCSLLVDWFGQQTEAVLAPLPAQPERTEQALRRATGAPQQKKRQQARLSSLLERWGDLWRSDQRQEKP